MEDSLSSATTTRAPGPGRCALWACVAEVSAAKAGNVHPEADFDDATWLDFVTSAMVSTPILEGATERGVGATVLACVQATRAAAGSNTNLGMILLLAPLCAVPRDRSLDVGIQPVLAALDERDAAAIYEAIRIAQPGGLGRVAAGDVHDEPTLSVLDAMRLAAERDAIARQYVTGFHQVLDVLAPRLGQLVRAGLPADQAIVRLHLEQMSAEPDSLIRRKCGDAVARDAQERSRRVIELGWPEGDAGRKAFAELDAWLRDRDEGDRSGRRNPGTSADLVTAAIFAALREGTIDYPLAWASSIRPLPCTS